MSSHSDNLFTALYRWVNKHDENYLSESFAYVLRWMFDYSPQNAVKFVDFMTRGQIHMDRLAWEQVKVTAQMYTDQHGTPDIWIESPHIDVAIEVKVDAQLFRGQLETYRKEMNSRGKSSKCLLFISRHDVGERAKEADVSIRWFQVADGLDHCVQDAEMDAVTKHLVVQFIEHLRFRRLAFAPLRTKLSAGIKQNLESDDAILASRVRNLDLLSEYDELDPLHHLLSLMRAAIDAVELDDSPMLDSAQSPTPWIGYNLQGMKYFFFMYLTNPEELVFETSYQFDMNLDQIGQLESGEYVTKKGKLDAWEIRCDLADRKRDFFSLSSDHQIGILVSFLEESYKEARKLDASV